MNGPMGRPVGSMYLGYLMTAKSLISKILYGHDVPIGSGRLISFGTDTGRPRSIKTINSEIIRFLQSVDMPCTLEEIAVEIEESVKVTSESVKALITMEILRCTSPTAGLRTYALVNYIAHQHRY